MTIYLSPLSLPTSYFLLPTPYSLLLTPDSCPLPPNFPILLHLIHSQDRRSPLMGQ